MNQINKIDSKLDSCDYANNRVLSDRTVNESDSEHISDIITQLGELGINLNNSDSGDNNADSSEMSSNGSNTGENNDLNADNVGKTSDPIRMYMREMGTVDLLDREGEIAISRKIEDGIKHILSALIKVPGEVPFILEEWQKVENNQLTLSELLLGFYDVEDLSSSASNDLLMAEQELSEEQLDR